MPRLKTVCTHPRTATSCYADGKCKVCAGLRAKKYYQASRKVRLEKFKAYYAATPEKQRRRKRLGKGILGLPEIEALSGHPCDCCGEPIRGTPHADHDHSTGRFRGWLCNTCNTGLGPIERPGFLQKALAYLKGQKRGTS